MSLVSSRNSILQASFIHDPGLNDVSHSFLALLKENFKKPPIQQQEERLTVWQVQRTYQQTPSAKGSFWKVTGSDSATVNLDTLAQYSLDDFPRTFALLCEEYQSNYAYYHTKMMLANTRNIQDAFRLHGMPIFWTTWIRSLTDGRYGALDRFAGTRLNVKNHTNFSSWFSSAKFTENYLYGRSDEILAEVAPRTASESLNVIRSGHYSKFADRDSLGNEILYPRLRKMGVNTLVLIGSFTEACIIATAIEAVDRYGMDVVLVHDSTASPSPLDVQIGALRVMAHGFVKITNTSEMINWLHHNARLHVA